MENVKEIIKIIEKKADSYKGKYYIPKIWNILEYKDYYIEDSRPNEIIVNPYNYYLHYLKYVLKQSNSSKKESIVGIEDSRIEQSIIYSVMIRLFTAWKHEENSLEYGTFFKTIALLPYLKQFNIDIIYLLPIFRCGEKYQKGNAGSVYSIKDLYKLDVNLHDHLLGACNDDLLELQFKALVEACHALGIKVMVDFVMRTASRDNDLMLEHPDWFYWIDEQSKHDFRPIEVESVPELTYLKDEVLEDIYSSNGLERYLGHFKFPPQIDKDKLNAEMSCNHTNILDFIEREYKVTTTPAFSDVLNDYQDPWFDVTYFKLSFDLHEKIKKYTNDNQPPYILQDIAKANLYCGNQINSELWSYIEKVIPYYQTNFNIDGARIDMAHALPKELNNKMISLCREINKDFILWSEEFLIENSKNASDQGYNFLTGEVFRGFRKFEQETFMNEMLSEYILPSKIPVISAIETPDTLRIPTIYTNKPLSKLLVVLSFLFPNTVPIINNGMEIEETMPMNVGLDNLEKLRDTIDADIEHMINNLPFFNKYQMDWAKSDQYEMFELLRQVSRLRKEYSNIFGNKNHLVYHGIEQDVYVLLYQDPINEEHMLCIINGDVNSPQKMVINKLLFNKIGKSYLVNDDEVNIIFLRNQTCSIIHNINEDIELDQFEIIVLVL
ncbi:Alpha-1,4-glucan:maltose-1-phosphate maltosyltransferase [compost metagenome]